MTARKAARRNASRRRPALTPGVVLEAIITAEALGQTGAEDEALAIRHKHKHWAMLGVCDQEQRRLNCLGVSGSESGEVRRRQEEQCAAILQGAAPP